MEENMGASADRHGRRESDRSGSGVTRREALALAAFGLVAGAPAAARAAGPQGELTWGVHTTLAPAWLDPAETPGFITPFMELYALHDAVVKPLPGQPMAPCLAESWSASEDGMTYDFVLRKGTMFHTGDPVTAEDVKFSFERYRGSSKDLLKDRVATIETPDPGHVRFTLKAPWPDFMTFYATATGASWVVPKKYVEKVGDDGFKKAPIGAGPYRFVSSTPGIDVVFEAFDHYWRKTPSVKRLVFKMIPDEATRLAALKAGEVDIVYSIRGPLAEELRRTPGLTLKPAVLQAPFYVYFPDQWDPKSPCMTSGCGGPRAWRLTARASMTRSRSATRRSPAARSRTRSIFTGSRRRRCTTRPRPSSSLPRRATRAASTPASSFATPPTRRSPRQSSTIS
jgi:peptide/nickel transport system substrate-binding protein